MAATLTRARQSGPPPQPLAFAQAPRGPHEPVADATSILLVDDEESSLRTLREVLAPLGQRIVTARSGEEALRLLLHGDYAVILLDMRMPGLDGLETARYIHARARTRYIPIVFLTARSDDLEPLRQAYAAGAVDYVVKPYDPDVLRSKVAVFVELQRARSEHVREARARAEAEAIADTVSKLQSVSDAALAHLDMDELLGEIVKRTTSVFAADAAGLLLGGDGDASLTLHTRTDVAGAPLRAMSPAERAQLLHSLRSGPLHAGDLAAERELPDAFVRSGLRSLVAVALTVAGRAVGALFLGWTRTDCFSPDDILVLRLGADRAAIAIEHARSYERERGLVETLQHHLLPDRLPRVPGLAMAARYQPSGRASQVGGDWYDAIVLPDGRVGLAIGDVIGHGIGAATLMGELRAALRAYALTESSSPARTLACLNSLVAHTHGAMVATLLYMVVEADGSVVRFASAAHPPPALIGADGEVALLEHRVAPPLGVAKHSEFREWERELAPGATMLLYTDGLIERRGEPIDAGLERLCRALRGRPSELEELCSQILLVSEDGASTHDDIALVAVRRSAGAGAPLQLQLPAEPDSVPLCRHRLERWLADTAATDDDAFAITLATNEACTNAVQHAYGPDWGHTFTLCASSSAEAIEVRVSDSGHWRAARGQQRGMGLGLIEQLMDDVDVRRDPAGTTIRMRKVLDGDAAR